MKDRIAKLIVATGFGLLGPSQTMIACPDIKQKQPQNRKTLFETLSLPVAKILSPVARQAPTKFGALSVANPLPPTPFSKPLKILRAIWQEFCGIFRTHELPDLSAPNHKSQITSDRTVSEYCSARVSRVGLSTK